MNQEEYNEICTTYGTTNMVRPSWDNHFHWEKWHGLVTVLICQRKTKKLTQLCLESLLTFYPEIPILVVDGNSQDDSTLYLRYKTCTHLNVKLWERVGRNSQGETMHEAIRDHIKSQYVLLLDSDTICMRPGFIEGMLEQFALDPKLYATGTLMAVTNKNDACGAPQSREDVLLYAHPSCSLYHRDTYLNLPPFCDHGAPCVYNNRDAWKSGLHIAGFPIDKYVLHLSGASWVQPQTIWPHDHGVMLRPFITFIATKECQVIDLKNQIDKDFSIVTPGNYTNDTKALHEYGNKIISNYLYDIRFNVTGEYVCLLNAGVDSLDPNIIRIIKETIIHQKAPDELTVGGLRVVRRNFWQLNDCFE
jgi:glycosyltransferase involved in cell wall biosynthesis